MKPNTKTFDNFDEYASILQTLKIPVKAVEFGFKGRKSRKNLA